MVSTKEFKGFGAGGYPSHRKSENLGIILHFSLVTSVLGVADIQRPYGSQDIILCTCTMLNLPGTVGPRPQVRWAGRPQWAERRVSKGEREDGERYNERGEDGGEVKGKVPCLLASPP